MPQDRRPQSGVNQDSWAWNVDSHQLGRDYYQQHFKAAGTLPGPQLLQLANKLFQPDPTKNQDLYIYQLQALLYTEDPATGFSPQLLSDVNALITRTMGDGKQYTFSYAQTVQIWHVLIGQEDMRLLAPTQPGALNW